MLKDMFAMVTFCNLNMIYLHQYTAERLVIFGQVFFLLRNLSITNFYEKKNLAKISEVKVYWR